MWFLMSGAHSKINRNARTFVRGKPAQEAYTVGHLAYPFTLIWKLEKDSSISCYKNTEKTNSNVQTYICTGREVSFY